MTIRGYHLRMKHHIVLVVGLVFCVGVSAAALSKKQYLEAVEKTAVSVGELLVCTKQYENGGYREEAVQLLAAMDNWHERRRVRIADRSLFEDKIKLSAEIAAVGVQTKKQCDSAAGMSRFQTKSWDKSKAADWLREKQGSVAVYVTFYGGDVSIQHDDPEGRLTSDDEVYWTLRTWPGWPAEETLLFLAPRPEILCRMHDTEKEGKAIRSSIPILKPATEAKRRRGKTL